MPRIVAAAAGRTPLLRLAVALVAVLGACWALVSPLASVPDEPAHVIYAAGVVRGDLGHGAGSSTVNVPGAVARSSALTCTAFKPSTTADCAPDLGADRALAPSVTPAARYPPLYYGLVGWPTLFGFGDATWYVMRLLSVALGASLLLIATTTWRRDSPAISVGLLVAATPMLGFMLGSVNPNGVEIVAGVAVVLAGCGTLSHRREGGVLPRRDLLVVTGLIGYLALARPSSYLLAAGLAAVMAVLACARPRSPRGTVGRLGLGVTAVLVLAVVAAKLVAPGSGSGAVASGDIGSQVSATLSGASGWLQETVGIFGWRDHQPPQLLRVGWLAVAATLTVAAVLVGSGVDRTALLLLVAGAFLAGPFFVSVALFPGGIGYQGRYAMALTQAVPVLAGAVLAMRGFSAPRALAPVPALLGSLSVLALGGSLLRYSVGLPLPSPGDLVSSVVWVPPTWPAVLVLLALGGWILVAITMALLSADDASPAVTTGCPTGRTG